VKVLVPGMHPVDFGGQWPHLGGDRLYDAPVRMGYPSTARDPSGLNLLPHPFP
jgi:ribosomal protein S12 methylthiotransferase accessory factor